MPVQVHPGAGSVPVGASAGTAASGATSAAGVLSGVAGEDPALVDADLAMDHRIFRWVAFLLGLGLFALACFPMGRLIIDNSPAQRFPYEVTGAEWSYGWVNAGLVLCGIACFVTMMIRSPRVGGRVALGIGGVMMAALLTFGGIAGAAIAILVQSVVTLPLIGLIVVAAKRVHRKRRLSFGWLPSFTYSMGWLIIVVTSFISLIALITMLSGVNKVADFVRLGLIGGVFLALGYVVMRCGRQAERAANAVAQWQPARKYVLAFVAILMGLWGCYTFFTPFQANALLGGEFSKARDPHGLAVEVQQITHLQRVVGPNLVLLLGMCGIGLLTAVGNAAMRKKGDPVMATVAIPEWARYTGK